MGIAFPALTFFIFHKEPVCNAELIAFPAHLPPNVLNAYRSLYLSKGHVWLARPTASAAPVARSVIDVEVDISSIMESANPANILA